MTKITLITSKIPSKSAPFPKKPAPNRYRTGAPRSSSAAAAVATLRSVSLQCSSSQTTTTTTTARRSGNYKPPLWDFNFIQSLTTQYTEEKHSRRAGELIVQVKMLLQQEKEGVPPLELIDDLHRLGISYHFHHQINQILNSSLSNDTRGVLQLYEASFLLTEGEESLELAKEFATNFLQRKLDEGDDEIDENLLASIRLALELPIHWRIQRPNARWFIEAYGRRPQMNPIVLELAKLDFNILQAIHQQELRLLSM